MPLSDILKNLEKSPIWRALTTLPARLEKVEKRLTTLEGKCATTAMDAITCPACGTTMRFVSERPDPIFRSLGFKEHRFKCECGYETTRQWSQQKGYR